MKDIIIFDIDGTLVESSLKIKKNHSNILNKLKNKYDIAICGGGELNKALEQMDNLIFFDHYFTECGCVYHINNSKKYLDLKQVYKKNIREHKLYPYINILIKEFLSFMSKVDFEITGHFVDMRSGIIYLSCIGMQANIKEREKFKKLDSQHSIRRDVLNSLRMKAKKLGISDDISINFGGTVGIGIYPIEYDKVQILDIIHKYNYNNIIYFGDQVLQEGNDFNIINHPDVKGYKVNNIKETYDIINNYLI